MDTVEYLESEGGVVRPLVSWTIKMLAPGSREPDFIRFEGPVEFGEMLAQVTLARAALTDEGYEEVGASSAPVKSQGKIGDGTVTREQSLDIVKFALERREDGRLQLNLFGRGHKYPDIRFTGDNASVIAMLAPVIEVMPDWELPIVRDLECVAIWTQGRETGKGGHYKDLVSLE